MKKTIGELLARGNQQVARNKLKHGGKFQLISHPRCYPATRDYHVIFSMTNAESFISNANTIQITDSR